MEPKIRQIIQQELDKLAAGEAADPKALYSTMEELDNSEFINTLGEIVDVVYKHAPESYVDYIWCAIGCRMIEHRDLEETLIAVLAMHWTDVNLAEYIRWLEIYLTAIWEKAVSFIVREPALRNAIVQQVQMGSEYPPVDLIFGIIALHKGVSSGVGSLFSYLDKRSGKSAIRAEVKQRILDLLLRNSGATDRLQIQSHVDQFIQYAKEKMPKEAEDCYEAAINIYNRNNTGDTIDEFNKLKCHENCEYLGTAFDPEVARRWSPQERMESPGGADASNGKSDVETESKQILLPEEKRLLDLAISLSINLYDDLNGCNLKPNSNVETLFSALGAQYRQLKGKKPCAFKLHAYVGRIMNREHYLRGICRNAKYALYSACRTTGKKSDDIQRLLPDLEMDILCFDVALASAYQRYLNQRDSFSEEWKAFMDAHKDVFMSLITKTGSMPTQYIGQPTINSKMKSDTAPPSASLVPHCSNYFADVSTRAERIKRDIEKFFTMIADEYGIATSRRENPKPCPALAEIQSCFVSVADPDACVGDITSTSSGYWYSDFTIIEGWSEYDEIKARQGCDRRWWAFWK